MLPESASESCSLWAHTTMQVASQQNAVSQKLHMLETHQKETHDSLVQMERTAISMYQVTCLICMICVPMLVQ